MAEVSETARLKCLAADDAWREIGGFEAVGAWHPMLARSTSEGAHEGARRHVETRDGAHLVERLTEMSPDERRYRYEMMETALPVRSCEAEFRIDDAGDNESLVTWRVTFEPPEAGEKEGAEELRRFLRAGLDNLEARYA